MLLEEIKEKVESYLNGNSESRIDLKKTDSETAEIATLINRLMGDNNRVSHDKEFFY